MTGRKAVTTRIEVEIEKSREEGSWTKVIELAEQLKEKSRDYGDKLPSAIAKNLPSLL